MVSSVAPSRSEWEAHYHVLSCAFSDWCPERDSQLQIFEDDSLHTRKMRRIIGDKSWLELLWTMDYSIEPNWMLEEAWLYYLPAFLMQPRFKIPMIGFDIGVLRIPPGDDVDFEPVSIEKLLACTNIEQQLAIKQHVLLHLRHEPYIDVFWEGYTAYIWEKFWSEFDPSDHTGDLTEA